MRPAETDLSAVLQTRLKPNINQLVAPASSLLPQVLALQRAHHQFLAVNFIHFFADNLLDILNHF